jgi:putative ABC transport system permease protein
MLRSFDGLAVRQLRTRPLRSALTAFGVVLGVGMVFGVLLLVATVRHTFDDLIDSAWGTTDLVVSPKAGMLSNDTIDRLLVIPGVRDAGGMIGAQFRRLDANGKPIGGMPGQMMVAAYDRGRFPPYDFKLVSGRWQQAGPELIVERNWARDRGIGVGDTIAAATPSGRVRLRVVGLFTFSSGLSFGGQGLAAMPLDAARRIMEQRSGWLQASIAADDRSQVDALQRRVETVLGPGAEVRTPTAFGKEIEKQLSGMNIVLYFFSGIALFVGGFLILNAFNMTVLQRMRELGMLRTLGASRRMIVRTVLTEAAAIGAVGTLLGLGLGIALAAGLIALMRTVGLPVGTLHVTPSAAITAIVVGLGVTVASALWPARRAGRIPPIQAVLGGRSPRTRPSLRRGLIGLALFLPGLVLGGRLWFGSASATKAMLGMLVTMAMFVGMAMAAPYMISPLVRVLAVPVRRLAPAGGRLAADAVRANPLRTAATAAALTIGLSVVVVNASMSASFLGTLRDQIDANLARDFTIQSQGAALETGGGPGVPNALWAKVRTMPETQAATPIRALVTTLPGSSEQGLITAYDPEAFAQLDHSPVKGASRAQALRDVARGGVIVGATYAKAAGLAPGDTVTLVGEGGRQRARVAAVLDSVGDFGGMTMQMALTTMDRVYNWTDDAQLAVKARDDAARASLERQLTALVKRDYPDLELQSAAGLKKQMQTEISRQFNIFNAIVAIAVIVSLLGVINTLAMSVLERTRELGLMRALGASRWQVRSSMLDESLLITCAGALAGLLLGLLIGYVWVMGLGDVLPGVAFHLPATTIISVAVAAVVLGTLAAILPARRAARLDVLAALKYE